MLNKMQIIGRVGKDPEFKVTQGGTPMCRFSVAVSEKWKDKQTGEAKEETEWFRLVMFNRLAETARDYVFKGQLIYVEGKMHFDTYENKEGVTVPTAEVRAGALTFLSYKDKGESGSGSAPQPAPASNHRADEGGFESDDLPF